MIYLQVHDLVFLLDCGWDEGCSQELLSPLRDVAGHLDAVLLSHPDPLHLGALPVLVRSLHQQSLVPHKELEQHMPIVTHAELCFTSPEGHLAQ